MKRLQLLDEIDTVLIKKIINDAVKLLIECLPTIKENSLTLFLSIIETLFTPKAILKQLILVSTIETTALTIRQVRSIIEHYSYKKSSSLPLLSILSSKKSKQINEFHRQQQHTTCQDEWMDIAEKIDYIQGNDIWRSDPNCVLYEKDRISQRIDELTSLMNSRNIFDLMFTLRGGIGRNKFGLLHEGLFSKAMAGSKILVETYHNVVCAALDYVCDAPQQQVYFQPNDDYPIPTDTKLAFFNETRHAYGRTALLLSGGAALGYYHVGVVKALMENNCLPRVMGAASAGSIVSGMVATRTDDECINDLFNFQGTNAPGHSGELRLTFFQSLDLTHNHNFNNKAKVQTFVPLGFRWMTSTLYDIFITGSRRPQDALKHDTNYFRENIKKNIGDFTFQEAFDRTGRILNITVTPRNRSDPPRLLNYLTAPHVLIWSAVVASSSLPGVFEANKLVVRDADGTTRYESIQTGQIFADGSIEADLPMTQLAEMFNVNHFIVSQANPHAVIFAGYNTDRSVWLNPIVGTMNSILSFLKGQLRAWLQHVVDLVGGRRYAPMFDTSRGVMSTFFTQEYEGRSCDISLIPWLNHRSLFSALMHLVYNPTIDEIQEWKLAAEREVWKHIPAIKSHCAEEMTLDSCVQRLRKRLISESYNNVQQQQQQQQQYSTGTMPLTSKMNERMPSFITNRSLVNMGGLAISDTYIHPESNTTNNNSSNNNQFSVNEGMVLDITTAPGWGGRGLSGCHSLKSLQTTTPHGSFSTTHSGLFFDEVAEEKNHDGGGAGAGGGKFSTSSNNVEHQQQQQVAGEHTSATAKVAPTNTAAPFVGRNYDYDGRGENSAASEKATTITPSLHIENENLNTTTGYVKTSSMANFYYRKSDSSSHLSSSSSLKHQG